MWKQTGSGQIFITFLFTAMPETKKVYGILMRSARRIPVILKSGTGKRRRVSWHYGATGDGSKGEGLYQGMQGARIRYTPTTAPEMGTETKRNMEVLLEADPAKSAGQGFGSAGQYLDVCIKTDTDTLDGYGLRIIRTAAHSDAVSMYLIQYVRGQAQCISREVVTNCFVTGCRIWVRYENGILSAKAWTVTEPTVVQQERGYAGEWSLRQK